MYGRPYLAAALSIAFEVTGWKGAGTVCRSRDHLDKTLQDFLISSYSVYEILRQICLEEKKYNLLEFLERLDKTTKKSVLVGEAFLLYNNVYSACTSPYVYDIDSNAMYATRYVLEQGLKQYLIFIERHPPSYYYRFSHSLFSKLSELKSPSQAMAIAKNIPFDPVISEATNTYPVARKLGKELLKYHRCRRPNSDIIDGLFKKVCERYLDYIVYRKLGLDVAREVKVICERGEELSHSLGSIADIVGTGLYYYVNECFSRGLGLL